MGLAFIVCANDNDGDRTGKSKMSGPYVTGAEAPDIYYNKKEPKKLNFLQRWFDQKCREAWNRAQCEPASPSRLIPMEDPGINSIDGLQIRLYGATGGHIVEFRKYDRHKDRTDCRMYVIHSERNFSEELAKVVSLEILR
jgi:hypothetical protein